MERIIARYRAARVCGLRKMKHATPPPGSGLNSGVQDPILFNFLVCFHLRRMDMRHRRRSFSLARIDVQPCRSSHAFSNNISDYARSDHNSKR